ncbi:MAG TPA: OmpA family protein [Azonexus sp.]|nr:OmpA family protein [Azonexus sp.]
MAFLAGCAGTSPVVPANPPPEARPVVSKSAPAVRPPLPSEALAMAAVDNENYVFFVLGASQIDATGRQKLRRHAERLKADPKLEVTLVGYTDDLGSPSYNLAIAELRVNAIQKELRGLGVRLNQMRRHVAGQEKVTPACQSTECRRKMRRVELVYAE